MGCFGRILFDGRDGPTEKAFGFVESACSIWPKFWCQYSLLSKKRFIAIADLDLCLYMDRNMNVILTCFDKDISHHFVMEGSARTNSKMVDMWDKFASSSMFEKGEVD